MTREISYSSLDKPLHADLGVTKGDLVHYLEAMADRMVPALSGRPLSVVRVRDGQPSFMQKNLPKHAPDWIERVDVWTPASKRTVTYALVEDADTLRWFGNQRAVEYHVPLRRGTESESPPEYLVLDLDPPEGAGFAAVVDAAMAVRRALDGAGLAAAVKTSGAKGLHVFVPLAPGTDAHDAAAATRALAGRAEREDPVAGTTAYIREEREGKVFLDSTRSYGATVVAAYSPRARPGLPVSFPLEWDELPGTDPRTYTVRDVPERLDGADPWAERMPDPQPLPAELVEEGHAIPVARVVAMHEGKRRKRAREAAGEE